MLETYGKCKNFILSQNLLKIISKFVILLLLLGISASFAQTEDEVLTERRLKVSDYRQKMMAGWIGQMAGVGWGAPTK
jgi:uncharacterized membrane protein YfcA